MATNLQWEDEEIVIPIFSGTKLQVWIAEMEEIMLRFQVPSIQRVNFAHVYVEGIASEWVQLHIDRICWMRWCQFAKALRSEFGEESAEKPFQFVDLDPGSDSICEKAIESMQSNSPHFHGIRKSIQAVQSVDTISVSDTVDVNDRHSIKASGDNRSIAPAFPVKVARVRDSVSQASVYIIIPELDDFVVKIDVPIAWQLYASKGNSKGLTQICCCSELNFWYAGRCYAQQCVVGIEIQYADHITNPDLELAAIVSNCVSSGKASHVANISHVSKEFFLGYGTVYTNMKWFTKQMVRTSSSFDAAVHISLNGSHVANYIISAVVACNPMHTTSIVQVDRSCLLVKTINPELVGAYQYAQHLGRQVIIPEKLKERVRGRSVSRDARVWKYFSCVYVSVSSGVTLWQDSRITLERATVFAQRSFTGGFYSTLGFTKVLSSICICNGIWGSVGDIRCENSLEILMLNGRCKIKLAYRSIGDEFGYRLGSGHYGGILSMSSNDQLAPKYTSPIYKVLSVVGPLQLEVGPRKSMMLCVATNFHAFVLADAYAYSLVEITINQNFVLQAFHHISCVRNAVYHRPTSVNEGMNLSLHALFSRFTFSQFNKISEYTSFGHVGFISSVNDPMTMLYLLLYDWASMNTLDVYEISVALEIFTRGGLGCNPEVSKMFHVIVIKGPVYGLLIVEMISLHISCPVTIFGVVSCVRTVSLPINGFRVTIQWLPDQNYTCYHFDLLDDNSQGPSVRLGISKWEQNLSLASRMLGIRTVQSLWRRIPEFFLISIRRKSIVALDYTLLGEDDVHGRQRGCMRQLTVGILIREPTCAKLTSWLPQGHEKNVGIFYLKGEWLGLLIYLSQGKQFIAKDASVLVRVQSRWVLRLQKNRRTVGKFQFRDVSCIAAGTRCDAFNRGSAVLAAVRQCCHITVSVFMLCFDHGPTSTLPNGCYYTSYMKNVVLAALVDLSELQCTRSLALRTAVLDNLQNTHQLTAPLIFFSVGVAEHTFFDMTFLGCPAYTDLGVVVQFLLLLNVDLTHNSTRVVSTVEEFCSAAALSSSCLRSSSSLHKVALQTNFNSTMGRYCANVGDAQVTKISTTYHLNSPFEYKLEWSQRCKYKRNGVIVWFNVLLNRNIFNGKGYCQSINLRTTIVNHTTAKAVISGVI